MVSNSQHQVITEAVRSIFVRVHSLIKKMIKLILNWMTQSTWPLPFGIWITLQKLRHFPQPSLSPSRQNLHSVSSKCNNIMEDEILGVWGVWDKKSAILINKYGCKVARQLQQFLNNSVKIFILCSTCLWLCVCYHIKCVSSPFGI